MKLLITLLLLKTFKRSINFKQLLRGRKLFNKKSFTSALRIVTSNSENHCSERKKGKKKTILQFGEEFTL